LGDLGLTRKELPRLKKKARTSAALLKVRIHAFWRKRWIRAALAVLAVPILLVFFTAGYYYVFFAKQIDARLHGERERVLPRVFARPLEIRRGQALTEPQLVDRLNDLGYAERAHVEKPGEFAIDGGAVIITPRGAAFNAGVVRVLFQRPQARSQAA